jgi:antitoxin (DNA-binding transcriptional repressor) of toxin-antitoxin stability system
MAMIKVNLEEAESHLGRLIEEAAAGQEVIIASADGLTVRLVLVPEGQAEREPGAATESRNRIGQALDRFIGTWSAEQEAEVLAAVEVFEQIDESLWQ